MLAIKKSQASPMKPILARTEKLEPALHPIFCTGEGGAVFRLLSKNVGIKTNLWYRFGFIWKQGITPCFHSLWTRFLSGNEGTVMSGHY